MKAGHVAALVDAVAEGMEAREKAASVTNDTHGLKLRVEAAEKFIDVVSEILLTGTSADPAAPTAKKAKK